MSNESRENLQGTDGQDVADLTATAGQAVPEPAAAAVDAAVEGATASSGGKLPEVRDVAVMLLESVKRGQ